MYNGITENFKIRNRNYKRNRLYKISILILIISILAIVITGSIVGYKMDNRIAYNDVKIAGLEYSLYNQVQYSIFLNDIAEYWGYETETYQVFLESYLYPNGELNQELHNKFIELGY